MRASPVSASPAVSWPQDARTPKKVAQVFGGRLPWWRKTLTRDLPRLTGVLSMMAPQGASRGSGANVAETAAVEEIYRVHARAMYGVAISVVRDHALAEDVVQESVVKAWRNLDSFRGEGGFRSWLLRITHNTAVSTLRKLKDISYDPSQIPDQPALGHDDVVGEAFMDAFTQALFGLDQLSRTVVTLREIEGMAYSDIARVVGTSEAVVKTRLYRARRHLAEALDSWRSV